MEETLSFQSEKDFLKAIEDNSQFLLTTFTQRHRKFDGARLRHLNSYYFYYKTVWLSFEDKRHTNCSSYFTFFFFLPI